MNEVLKQVPTQQLSNSLEDLQYFLRKAIKVVERDRAPHPAMHLLRQTDVLLNCIIQSQPTT